MTRRCGNCRHFRGAGEKCASPDWLIATRALRWPEDGEWRKEHEREMERLIKAGDVVTVTCPMSVSVYDARDGEGRLDVVVAFNQSDGASVFSISADLAADLGETLLLAAKKVKAKNEASDV